jgi:hypothetical protein
VPVRTAALAIRADPTARAASSRLRCANPTTPNRRKENHEHQSGDSRRHLLGALGLGACSSLSVTPVSRLSEGATRSHGGVRYALTKPVWNVRVKGTLDGAPVTPIQRVYEIETEPAYVSDTRHVYEVNMKRGLFSSDGVTVNVNEAGALTGIDSVSEPQIIETVRVVAALAGTVAAAAAVDDDNPLKREERRLKALEDQLVKAIEKAGQGIEQGPTKESGETLQLLQGQLRATRTALADVRAKMKAQAAGPVGDTVSQVSQLEPWVCDKFPFPSVDRMKERFEFGTKAGVVVIAPPGSPVAKENEPDGCRPWSAASTAVTTKARLRGATSSRWVCATTARCRR